MSSDCAFNRAGRAVAPCPVVTPSPVGLGSALSGLYCVEKIKGAIAINADNVMRIEDNGGEFLAVTLNGAEIPNVVNYCIKQIHAQKSLVTLEVEVALPSIVVRAQSVNENGEVH